MFLVFDGRPRNFQTSVLKGSPQVVRPECKLFLDGDLFNIVAREQLLSTPEATGQRMQERTRFGYELNTHPTNPKPLKTEAAAHIFEVSLTSL